MTLKRMTPEQADAFRDSVEANLLPVVNRQMKAWLKDVRLATLAAVDTSNRTVLLAAAGDEVPPLGTIAAWWATRVDTVIVEAVRNELIRAWGRNTDMIIEASPAMAATNAYLGEVRDRLVVGTYFGSTVYEDSFDKIRQSLAASAANGWTRPELAQRIAAELSWEKEGPYWRGQLATVDSQIDAILDPLGAPGNPVREAARLNDPEVARLRALRNTAIKRLDAERSTWQVRANLIARTESTGGANFGAHQALLMEGVATKVWLATGDSRTRPSHKAADGQEAPNEGMFLVGGHLMRFPGDPMAPVDEVTNCRCSMIGGDYVSPEDRPTAPRFQEGLE